MSNTEKKGPLKLIIAGAPASGKGTQCELIVAKYGLIHISTGDILRANVKNQTDLGKKAKPYMDKGQLVPDELMCDMVVKRLQEEDCLKKGWLLDGFPRTGTQAEHLIKAKLVPDAVILLDVPDEEVIKRICGRRTDPVTGKVYHIDFNPPPTEEIKKRVIQRSDDNENAIKTRLVAYHSALDSVLKAFPGIIHKVNGKQAIDRVSEDVNKVIESVLKK